MQEDNLKRIRIILIVLVVFLTGVILYVLVSGKPLKLSLHPWPGYESFVVAEHFSWLPDDISVVQVKNASQSLALLEAGEVQAAALTLDEALYARSRGVPLDIVAILDESVGADVLMSQKEQASWVDLKGSRIAYEGNTVSAIVLHEVFKASGFDKNDVDIVEIPPNDQVVFWDTKAFDYAITFEPYASYLEQKGAFRVYDSRDFPGIIYDVLVVRRDARFFRESAITELLAAHFKALQYLRVNSEDALRRIAAWRSLSYEENRKVFSGLYLPDLDYNKRMLTLDSEFYQAIQLINLSMNNGLPLLPDYQLRALLQPAFLFRIE
ncbi:ABC transporter substrate-binding protein [Rhodanobacter aciditrophus]|uniref:ABC transporter substrate-binding protein n=1 Tax=Rhodanobacter aciditrophus TaxID=1623218 RepID=A0ABW4AWA1_9GAMM